MTLSPEVTPVRHTVWSLSNHIHDAEGPPFRPALSTGKNVALPVWAGILAAPMGVTWLHISDFHVRGGNPYDRNVVLDALVESVAKYRQQGRAADVIFATGDIAFSGKATEYEIAETFFDALLEAAHLKRDRLYVIPGNHDVDRGKAAGLARTLNSREESQDYFDPQNQKTHLTLRMKAFLEWHNRYFKGIRVAPDDSTCGPVQPLELNGVKLGILPINSALFCVDDNDHAKLWVGRNCLDKAIAEVKALRADLNVVLMHHPLEWLHPVEAENIQGALERLGHVLLRGHLHTTRIEVVSSADGELLRIAAGATYDTRLWPMRAMYATLDGGHITIFPIRYEDAPVEKWTVDSSAFPDGGENTFEVKKTPPVVPRQPEKVVPRGLRSNVSARGNFPFVGREAVMRAIDAALKDPKHEGVVVLHGQAGAGKTAAAKEFARQHVDRYPGGTFLVDATKEAIAIELANVGRVHLDMEFRAGLSLDEQGTQTFLALGKSQALLIYDNVQSFERVKPWLPLAGMLCHALVTTLEDILDVTWPVVEVKPLTSKQSSELVDRLTGGKLPKEVVQMIVEDAGGLPVQLVPSAAMMAKRPRRLKTTTLLAMAAETKGSFSGAYGRLKGAAKTLLHAAATMTPERIPIAELTLHLTEGFGWNEAEVDRTLEMCFELHLLEGEPDPAMHQLFARYLREMALDEVETVELKKVRKAQARRVVELAGEIGKNPADSGKVSLLLAYPLVPQRWEALGEPLTGDAGRSIGHALYQVGRFSDACIWWNGALVEAETPNSDGLIDHDRVGYVLHVIGYCLFGVGKYAQARERYEQAVDRKQKGDLHGLVNHASLGESLDEAGLCRSRVGEYGNALSWHKRAVQEKKKGDARGRVSHESLSKSLHEVGVCQLRLGKYPKALPWFKRAIQETEKGDENGFVDHESLGLSLGQMSRCLVRTEQFEQALPLARRAVEKAEKGDVHGRIDHEILSNHLHLTGTCLSKLKSYDDALPWFQRAVVESEKGDKFGRVDHESVALSMDAVENCLMELDRDPEARDWCERAKAERAKIASSLPRDADPPAAPTDNESARLKG